MSEAASRFSLRDLPFPAKLVITCFLLAVGGGYTAAMVQLHMQDSRSGEMLPSVHDVVLKYTGKKWFKTEADVPKPASHFVKLITAPESAPFNGTGTMQPAFTAQDGGSFSRIDRAGGAQAEKLRPQRLGERDVLVQWAESRPEERKKAFENDHFDIKDKAKEPKEVTPEFKHEGAYKVKSIIEARCTRCHKPDGDNSSAASFPLVTYEHIEKYLSVPTLGQFRADGDWVKVQEPIGLEKLTQTTHAHLLSFAVLFSLTGLVFAFTSYPTVVRCIVGPLVLVAVVADVSLWWLARLCSDWGPYFAMGIIGTGGAAGLGLVLQITLSLFNMYGPKGKLVILLLFLAAGAGGGLVFKNKIEPGLKEKKERLTAKADEKKDDAKTDIAKKADPKPDNTKGSKEGNGNGTNGGNGGTVAPKLSAFHRVLQFPVKGPDGKELAVHEIPFKKDPGGMVRALFDKDKAEFQDAVKGKDTAAQQKLMPERHGEREALLAWAALAEAERRKAFESDAFALPATLAGKPITADYVKDGKVKVKSIITQRCVSCHESEDKAQFEDYDSLLKFLK